MSAKLTQWVADTPDAEVQRALRQLAEAPDGEHVAVMPDVQRRHHPHVGVRAGESAC